LEEARRTITALTAEKDHYKEFWQAMNNYHNVMSRFQVSAATAGPPISFPFNPVSQGVANPFISSFPMYNTQAPNAGPQSQEQLSSSPLQSHQSNTGAGAHPTHQGTPSRSASTQPMDLSSPLAPQRSQPPETPKKEAAKPIESYFSKSSAKLQSITETGTPAETGNQMNNPEHAGDGSLNDRPEESMKTVDDYLNPYAFP
jgi:hypothetical protein